MKIPTLGRWWPRRERAPSGAVVAVRVSEGEFGGPAQIDFARVEAGGAEGGRPRLARHGRGPASQLGVWRSSGAFADAQLVLMLRASQRQILVLDQPEVPESEQADALRWPVAEALDAPAEGVLFDATPLPELNDSGKRQVLVAAASLRNVQPLLDLLAQAGLRPHAIDVADMAQRNAVLLQRPGATQGAQIVLGSSGAEMLLALVAGGELCVARNLPLPATLSASDDAAVRDRIVLHVQRTVDLLERQITRFAINGAYVIAGAFAPATLDALRQVLPVDLKEIGLADVAVLDSADAAPADDTTIRLAALGALRCAAPVEQAVKREAVAA
jgi:MSHA biogenesis protein MshI